MPLIVAQLVRILIQAATTTGIFIASEKILGPLTDAAKFAVKKVFNMTDEEAEDTIANEIIDAFAMIGIIGITIKTKLPTKVAEKLGFASKGFRKRIGSSKLPASAKGGAAKNVSVAKTGRALTAAEIETGFVAANAGVSGFSTAATVSLKWFDRAFLYSLVIAQWVDFGNWNSGAYQKKMQKLLGFITFGLLVPDEDYRRTKTASPEVFSKVFNAYQLEGAVSIKDPFKEETVPFTRDNLLDVVDRVGAGLLVSKGSASTKEVLAATAMMIVFKDGATAPTVGVKLAGGVATRGVKTFIGTVSSGVLGKGLSFTPRPDDLIESMDELQSAINDNLSPWLVALPSRLIYEIKVVSSIIGADGVKKVGEARSIVTGQDKDGADKTKTVINKWAVMDIYAFTDKKTRTKITSIVLGPTDAVKFHPRLQELAPLSQAVASNAVSTSTDDIDVVVSATPTREQTIAPEAAIKASTLFEYYQMKGQPLPSLSERGLLFQSLGLGSASLYAGTAEQNTRLLNKLQEQSPLVEDLTASTRAIAPERVPPIPPEIFRQIPPEPQTQEFYIQRRAEGRSSTLPKRTIQAMLREGQTLDEIVNIVNDGIKSGNTEQFHSVTLAWLNSLAS